MAATKISAEAAAAALDGTELVPAVQGGANKKATVLQIATAATGQAAVNGTTRTTSAPLLNHTQTWNDAGVAFAGWTINITDTASAAGSRLMNLLVGGASKFAVSKAGSPIIADAASYSWSSRGFLKANADGVWSLNNNAGDGFTRLQFGGTTSSFPAIKRDATALNFRLADDSGDAAITAGTCTFANVFGNQFIAPHHAVTNSGYLTGPGVAGILRLTDPDFLDILRVQWGGTSSSFPSWARSGAGFIARLADDSADTFVKASAFRTGSDHIVVDTGTSLTLTAAHNGKTITSNNAAAVTITVPSGLGVGFSCTVIQIGAGQVTFATSGTTINPAATLKISAQHGVASLFSYATDVYNLAGTISA